MGRYHMATDTPADAIRKDKKRLAAAAKANERVATLEAALERMQQTLEDERRRATGRVRALERQLKQRPPAAPPSPPPPPPREPSHTGSSDGASAESSVEAALRHRVAELEAALSRRRGGMRGTGRHASLVEGSASFGLGSARAEELVGELRRSMLRQLARVIDTFRQMDADGSGAVSREEFIRALPMCGIVLPPAEAELLFASIDHDGNGIIEYRELNRLLRQGADVKLEHALTTGTVEVKLGKLQGAARTRFGQFGPGHTGGDREATLEALRASLVESCSRVIDAFRRLDRDGDGSITKREFRGALPLLGFDTSRTDLTDALFETLDVDGGGSISFEELHAALRQGATVELNEALQAGARGDIVTHAKNPIGLQRGLHERGRTFALRAPTVAGVREALARGHARVIDFFRAVDKNGDGRVSKAEFRAALPLLGMPLPPGAEEDAASLVVIDALFDSFDVDGSGDLTFDELRTILRYEATRLEQEEEVEEVEAVEEQEEEGSKST